MEDRERSFERRGIAEEADAERSGEAEDIRGKQEVARILQGGERVGGKRPRRRRNDGHPGLGERDLPAVPFERRDDAREVRTGAIERDAHRFVVAIKGGKRAMRGRLARVSR